jgi:peptide/nickel transport system substrate-binding protein
MKRGAICLLVTCLMVTSLILASCATATTSSTPSSTTTSTTITTTSSVHSSVTSPNPSTTIVSTSAATGNWWDKLGMPQYGGTMTLRINKDITNFDPFFYSSLITIETGWMERLFTNDWTLDPSTFGYQAMYRPNDYVKGQLAQSWEFTDPTTLTVHIRQNVYWQNIPPANGRQFIASDVAAHYNRLYDPTTGGFTKGGPFASGGGLPSLISVTATDKFTVVFKWKINNPEFVYETVELGAKSELSIECPDAVAQWGDVSDWHHAIGTGPFILKDFVGGASATLVKNPNYWGHDERYPQNQLPYVDELKILIITDDTTALAALRTGKIDNIDGMSFTQAQGIQKTNPQITTINIPVQNSTSLDPRNDVKPFSDIKVREALQMAIDLPTIAKTYYNNTAQPYPVAMTSAYMTGWGFPYTQWPQDLKDQYAYNPTQAKKLLSDAGYPNGFNTDIVVDTAYDVGLLEIIKSYFSAIGVNLDIRTLDSATWQAFVGLGHKNDQMAALSTGGILCKNSEPILQLNKFIIANYPNNWPMVFDSYFDKAYAQALAATSVDQVKQILKDENEYMARQHEVISLLQPMSFSLSQPWFKGYVGQYGATYGSWGPSYLGFYTARFWIDQNIKK